MVNVSNIYGFINKILEVFILIFYRFLPSYRYDINRIRIIFNNILYSTNDNNTVNRQSSNDGSTIKIGLLTNEIPPIIYGGVATWIVNFIKMFEGDTDIEVVPIFLAYNDTLPKECYMKYKNIRVINTREDINNTFNDINVCINNLWISEDTIIDIKNIFPNINIITVCHSLIRMENITNLGSCYTNNYNLQEITFKESDYVVLISKAEEKYYNLFGYSNINENTRVIYNSYKPQYDNKNKNINYESNDIGYIGRHVPRKRPELPIIAVDKLNKSDIHVFNMGVDYDKYDNEYWRILENRYKGKLTIIPFTSDKKIKEEYWKNIGINCITGIYEPFGYTICESIDRGIPVVVSYIDGPKEIIDEVKDYVYTYDVDIDNYNIDIDNISKALIKVWDTPPKQREINSRLARVCLDKLRPEVIKEEWKKLIYEIINN